MKNEFESQTKPGGTADPRQTKANCMRAQVPDEITLASRLRAWRIMEYPSISSGFQEVERGFFRVGGKQDGRIKSPGSLKELGS